MLTVSDGRMYERVLLRCIVRFFPAEGAGGVKCQVILGVLLGIVFQEVANHRIHCEAVWAENVIRGKRFTAAGA